MTSTTTLVLPKRAPKTTLGDALGAFVRNRAGLTAAIFLLFITLVAIFAPLLWPQVLAERVGDLALPKAPIGTPAHLLGTDSLGRDLLLRLAVGAGVTMAGVCIALVVAGVIGCVAGLIAGYWGGTVDRVISAVANLLFSLPAIILILLVLAVYPMSMTAAMITLGVLAAPGIMRIIRSAVLPVKAELYVAAAKTFGVSDARILVRHVLPRVSGPILVQLSLTAATALLTQTGLAFLGLINEAPAPSWGGAIAEASQNIITDPWMIWAPGIVIILTCLAFGVLGDAIRDVNGEKQTRGSVLSRRRGPRPVLVAPAVDADPSAVLQVDGLTVVHTRTDGSVAPIVTDVTFSIGRGQALALVGESGCGKSITSAALFEALPPALAVTGGSALLDGVSLLDPATAPRLRGVRIGLIAQEPMASLNPVFRVGDQVAEAVRQHRKIGRRAAKAASIELLRAVGLPNAAEIWHAFPHELSGGMAQRVAIARALAGDPDVLVADEPTTALDVTVQAEILALLRRLQREREMALLLISHDWGVVAQTCDRVAVMYAGEIIETGTTAEILDAPKHPYTKALIAANPFYAVRKQPLLTIPGTVPPPGAWPAGCRFAARCAVVIPGRCDTAPPQLVQIDRERAVRCVRAEPAAERVQVRA